MPKDEQDTYSSQYPAQHRLLPDAGFRICETGSRPLSTCPPLKVKEASNHNSNNWRRNGWACVPLSLEVKKKACGQPGGGCPSLSGTVQIGQTECTRAVWEQVSPELETRGRSEQSLQQSQPGRSGSLDIGSLHFSPHQLPVTV